MTLKGFLELVNLIEKGYAELRRLNLEREMSNSVTVSIIEAKLPPSIRFANFLCITDSRQYNT